MKRTGIPFILVAILSCSSQKKTAVSGDAFVLTEVSSDHTYGLSPKNPCPIESKNGFMGMAMLDNYRVTWEGSKDTVSIYINMYDYGVLKAPVGFTIR